MYFCSLGSASLALGGQTRAAFPSAIDGQNGTNGTNGENGITPQLKIENEYWYVSYDSGVTWQVLGKATGPKGDEGQSFFSSIIIGNYEVTFILADGTSFCIPLYFGGDGIDEEGHEWVDLGLPSGTLWATCNVGANSPEEYGDYYAWGETKAKDEYNWYTYKYSKGTAESLTKYNSYSKFGFNGFTDDISVLLPEDDAATANWGSGWQMPTGEQLQELYDNISHEWTTLNGVGGVLLKGLRGGQIFLPAAGYRWNEELKYTGSGCYWSSSLNDTSSGNGFNLLFGSSYWEWCETALGGRASGRSVRPVRKQ